jgi:beta-glucosidase
MRDENTVSREQNAFPTDFIWGAATAAHQVEGGNYNSDIWALENATPSVFREPSGAAIDQWNRFSDDVALLAALGLKAYRFSIEWARIEPTQGLFSIAALDHYQRCIDACLQRGIEPIITFHHFTLPLWVVQLGGFSTPKIADLFAAFCSKASRHLRGFRTACTINELNVPILVRPLVDAAVLGPGSEAKRAAAEKALGAPISSSFLFTPVDAIVEHGLAAHVRARDAIKAEVPGANVGITLSIQDEQAEPGAEHLRDQRLANYVTPFLESVRSDDYIGVQNYTRSVTKRDGTSGPAEGHPITMMGYEDRPQALAEVCRYVWRQTGTPIIVTESGWAGENDARRCGFIAEAVSELHKAIAEGVDVRGYLYWSLLDNYEWLAGYGPKFGLIAVDRSTMRRTIKPSALVLSRIAQANAMVSVSEAGQAAEPPGQSAASLGGTPLGVA